MALPATTRASELAHVTGTLTNAASLPIHGLQVLLVPTDGSSPAATLSDEHGAYSVAAPAGDYSLLFVDSSGTYVYGCYDPHRDGNYVALTGPVMCWMVTLAAGESFNVDATIARARHIRGTVAGSDGALLGRVLVDAYDADGNAQAETRAAADGSFTLTMPVGSYQVEVAGTTLYSGGCYTGSGNVSPDDVGCRLLNLADSDSTGVNMTLGRKDVSRLLRISGIVTGPDGSGLSYVQVGAGESFGFTDQSGHYSLALSPGDYRVEVSDWGLTYPWGCYNQTAAGHVSSDPATCDTVTLSSTDLEVDMSMPLGGQTPTGTGVWVMPSESGGSPVNASVSFSQVDTSGNTNLAISASGPESGGFSPGLSPTYYDVSTDAEYTGPVSVCVPFDPAAYTDASALRLYHFDSGVWMDVTTSISWFPPMICGTTMSLSPFVVGQAAARQAQSISFNAIADRTYGDGPVALTATASSGLPVEYAASGACALSGDLAVITGAGTCSVTASQPGNDSWPAADPVTVSFAVHPANLVVTANSTRKLLHARNPPLTATITGFVKGQTLATSGVTGSAACSTSSTVTSGVGPYPITCTRGSLAAANYAFTFVAGTLSVHYRFDGFLQPINDTAYWQSCGSWCTFGVFRAGSTIPVRFKLKDVNGSVVQAGSLPVWATPVRVSLIPSFGAADHAQPASTGATFRSDGSGYIYNWSTKGLKAGIYMLTVVLDDGTTQRVFIGLR